MFRNTSLFVILIFVLAASVSCSKKEKRTLRTDFLDLGKPGEEIKENKISKSENVVILNEDQNITFVTDEGLVKISNYPIEPLNTGSVIVGNSKNPVILEVKSIDSAHYNNERLLKTESASISKLSGTKPASFYYQVTPEWKPWNPDELKKETNNKTEYFMSDDGTVNIKNMELFNIEIDPAKTINSVSKLINIKRPPTLGKDIKFNLESPGSFRAVINEAKVKFIPTFRTSYDMKNGKLESAKTRMDTLFTYSVDITYFYSAATELEVKIPMFPTKKIPVRIPGAVPIYMDIEFNLPAGIKLKTERSGQTRVSYTAEYAFMSDLEYNSESGLGKKSDSDHIVNYTNLEAPDSNSAVSAELFIKPKVTTRLYRVLGPHAYLNPYIRSELKVPLQMGDDELFVGLTGGVGLQVSEPIFLKELINLDSGPLFDLFKSWDLILPFKDKSPPLINVENLKFITDQKFTIDSLGKEGFVSLQLKNPNERRPLTFNLIKSPRNGIIVPSEDFMVSGELFYYPLAKTKESAMDEIEFQFVDSGTKGPIQKIVLESSNTVIRNNQRPRFAITNNSVEVNYSSPEEFKDQVLQYTVGPLVGTNLTGQVFNTVQVTAAVYESYITTDVNPILLLQAFMIRSLPYGKKEEVNEELYWCLRTGGQNSSANIKIQKNYDNYDLVVKGSFEVDLEIKTDLGKECNFISSKHLRSYLTNNYFFGDVNVDSYKTGRQKEEFIIKIRTSLDYQQLRDGVNIFGKNLKFNENEEIVEINNSYNDVDVVYEKEDSKIFNKSRHATRKK